MKYIYYEAIDSTNNELKRRLAGEVPTVGASVGGFAEDRFVNAGDVRDRGSECTGKSGFGDGRPAEFTVISAGLQTAGRGRSGHDWISPPGVSIATSMILYPEELSVQRFPQLTIVAAMAVSEAVEEYCGLRTQIKWPNDILVERKKICGILTERIAEAVIIGIGVNVYPGSYPSELEARATSLAEVMDAQTSSPAEAMDTQACSLAEVKGNSLHFGRAGKPLQGRSLPGRKRLTEAIWEKFVTLYHAFRQEQDLSFLSEAYNKRLVNAGAVVRIMNPAGSYEAVAVRMDEAGRLVVDRTDRGERCLVDSGEVHVRGLDGYV